MKVYTTAPVGTVVKIKLEGGGSFDIDATTSVSGTWEPLTWNFSSAPSFHNRVLFMFNAGTLGNGTANSTYYFDDITQIESPATLPLRINFEASSIVTSNLINFDGGVGTVISNPQSGGINTSGTGGQVIKRGGQPWGGTKLPWGNNLDFTTYSYIIMKFYTTAPGGTYVTFKLEGLGAAQTNARTTVSGAWETLSFNFTGQPANFNAVVFLVNVQEGGTKIVGDGTANSTFFFDDIIQSADGINPVPNPDDTPVTSTLSKVTSFFVNTYPNPSKETWTISSEPSTMKWVIVYDFYGNELTVSYPNASSAIIDASKLSDGVYTAKISSGDNSSVVKLVKY